VTNEVEERGRRDRGRGKLFVVTRQRRGKPIEDSRRENPNRSGGAGRGEPALRETLEDRITAGGKDARAGVLN